jgi:hypothetical protein
MEITKEHMVNVFKQYIEVLKRNDVKGFKWGYNRDTLKSDYLYSVIAAWISDLYKSRLISKSAYDDFYDETTVGDSILKECFPESILNNAVQEIDNLQSLCIYSFTIRENKEVFNDEDPINELQLPTRLDF